jgi:hypothetical protein
MINKGVKVGNTADFSIDLQLFADEEFKEAPKAPATENFNFEQAMQSSEVPEQESAKEEPATPKPVQSQDDNAKFAAARREAEAEKQRIISEREQDAVDAGFENYAEMQKYIKEQKEAAKQAEFQEKYGLDPNAVSEAFKQTPEYQEWQKEKQSKAELEIKTQQEKALNKAITDFSTEYPEYNVKDINDVLKLPNYDKIYDHVQKGYDLVDAFEKANRDILKQKMTGAIKQATLNQLASKNHLKGSEGNVELEPVILDKDTLAIYQKMGFSETQAQAYHSKNYKK